jgi:hypothetical protein
MSIFIFPFLSINHRLRHDQPQGGRIQEFLAGKFRGKMEAIPDFPK